MAGNSMHMCSVPVIALEHPSVFIYLALPSQEDYSFGKVIVYIP